LDLEFSFGEITSSPILHFVIRHSLHVQRENQSHWGLEGRWDINSRTLSLNFFLVPTLVIPARR